MRLLLDQNISFRVAGMLASEYPGSLHVRDVSMESADDDVVWQYAKENGLIIVSKDSDFHDSSLLRGAPPKVIWLRIGNSTTQQILDILRKHIKEIRDFEQSEEETFLVLS